jgi:hypothetical protein
VHAENLSPLVEGLLSQGGVVCPRWQVPLLTAVYAAQSDAADSESTARDRPEPDPEAYAIERRFVRPLAFQTDDAGLRGRLHALRSAVLQILQKSGESTRAVAIETLSYEGSSVRGQLSVSVSDDALATSPLKRDGRRVGGTLVIDAGHAQLQPIVPLCDREPELAAYTLLKLILLGQMTAERDSVLMSAAMETRWQRMKS